MKNIKKLTENVISFLTKKFVKNGKIMLKKALKKTIQESSAEFFGSFNFELAGISKDTRTIEKSEAYIAIKGENFDGHFFIENAIQKGASLIISEKKGNYKNPYVFCENSLEFIQKWANNYRNLVKTTFFALTGSNGKTTTKELIYTLLSEKYSVYRTPGNYNNDIGVPFTLLNMPENTEIAVVELGTNHPGEIGFLADILEPDYAFITSISAAHMEFFDSLEAVFEEKTSLFSRIKEENTIFINSADKYLQNYKSRHQKWTVGTKDSKTFVSYKGFKNGKMQIEIPNGEVSIDLLGKHHLTNIAGSVAVAEFFELSTEQIKVGLEKFQPVSGRMQWIEKKDFSFIDDAYNANPKSMRAALKFFESIETEKSKVAILGDMLELGNQSEREHQKIVNEFSGKFEKTIFYGKIFKKFAKSENFFNSHEEIRAFLAKNYQNAIILLKGSRGMKLESIMENS
jgi:UDP-N-acetylmuramoyl-tripeptide--D-alanyl-D-alanine ligase